MTKDQLAFWNKEGYFIARGLFAASEVATIQQHFEVFSTDGKPVENYWEPDLSATDPLKRYPRVMQPHRWDNFTKPYLLDPRVHDILAALLGEEPIAAQSMFYFKPPGARGQAMHQDNFYLQVKPGSCIAAWTAIDPATTGNGGLYVVPGTQNMDVVCPEDAADESQSFTSHLVRAPKGMKAIPTELQPGDTLFFNGSLIHGSGPNRSKTMWRRSLICHYMPQSARYISKWYFPLFDFAGNVVEYEPSADGGPCGKEFEVVEYGGKWH